jgi:hypothetical protein
MTVVPGKQGTTGVEDVQAQPDDIKVVVDLAP